jgi:hypothetical protein
VEDKSDEKLSHNTREAHSWNDHGQLGVKSRDRNAENRERRTAEVKPTSHGGALPVGEGAS